jgi:tetratricopeptide (TPR) repeat protein
MKNKKLFIISVALAFFVRALHIFLMSDPVRNPAFLNPITDGAVNQKWALELLSGNWPAGEPFFRAPGFTYLLAGLYGLFNESRLPVQLVLGLIASIGAGLNALTAGRLWGSVAGWIAGVMTALLWSGVWFAGELLDAAIFASMLSAILWLLTGELSRKKSIALGLIMGLAIVVRPVALLLLPLLFFHKKNMRFILMALFLPILPVTIHNATSGAGLAPVAVSGGTNFYIGNNQISDGRVAFLPGLPPEWQGEPADVITLASKQSGRQLNLAEADQWFAKQGLKWIVENPGSASILYLKKLNYLLAGNEYSNNKNLDFWRSRAPVITWLSWCGWALILTLAVIGASRPEKRKLIWCGFILLALSMMPFFINARFRLPLMVWLIVPAAGGADQIFRAIKHKKQLPVKYISVALLAFMGSAFFTVKPADSSNFNSYQTLGNSFVQSKMYIDAAKAYDQAIAVDNEFPNRHNEHSLSRVYKMRGEIFVMYRDNAGAQNIYQQWANRLPDDKQARTLLGWALLGSGDYPQALKEFRIAGNDPQAVFGKGMCLMQLGESENAIKAFRDVVQEQPNYWQAWGNLASLLDQVNQPEQALEAWKQVLRLNPNDQMAKQRIQGN